ncbi:MULTISPECIES: arylsulfatase [unclassified Microbacterium]|uniref:arylsulfatase n=1 Tax=unclassified Microbacterium TaxID=2609290 RepID=UPI00160534FA|nr:MULTISPECIES: arylsulfatase [unclassified Microbacterium]QNA93588.1 arylsulfatase [Microbacterium sp. Se63.02b]QYM63847.1 arylsulfatase [Microbacterium sp. Se5.02b]
MSADSRRPHVVVVLFDDMGYSDLGCYGSSIRTPHIDRLAAEGLRYTGFDVTPLCSPTRAALLTGRNPHAVGMGTIVQFASGDPGYTGSIPSSAAMLPLLLKDAGYASGLFGKWHLSPNAASGPGGPYDEWPLARGFDRFFGFLAGRVHQFRPELVQDNSFVDLAAYGGRHISEIIVDEAVRWITDHRYARPDDPSFAMLSFGAVHSPHHAPREYLDRYRGAFAHGWEEERRRRFERQRELGVIPVDTVLPEADPAIPVWESLTAEERDVAERLMEAYAAHLEHADAELGRLLDAIAAADPEGETLVVVLSDNGATNAGGPLGALSEEAVLNDAPEGAVEVDLAAIGTGRYYNQYPAGWGQASNTPFRRYKHTVHAGGTRSPLIISGAPVSRRGMHDDTRSFVTDLVPTVLELAGVEPPSTVRGIEQMPLHGRSLVPTFTATDALGERAPQYFEVAGHRALLADGWKAVTFHRQGDDFADDRWELYHLDADPAETTDLSARHPQRLVKLIELWNEQAAANQVFPLGNRGKSQLFAEHPDRTRWILVPGMTPVPQAAAPAISGHDFSVEVDLSPVGGADEGVLLAMGDRFGGVSLYVRDGRLTFAVNALEAVTAVSLARGEHVGARKVQATLVLTEGRSATIRVGTDVTSTPADADVSWVPQLRFFMGSAQCGRDQDASVVRDYDGRFPYTGRILRATVEIHPRPRSGEQSEALLRELMDG